MAAHSYLFVLLVCTVGNSLAIESWFDDIIPKDYNPLIFPNQGGKPVSVNVSMYVLSMHDFDPLTMQVTADLYMRQHWKDYRLTSEVTKLTDSVALPDGHKRIWVPDMFFVNAIQVTQAGGPSSFLRINKDGTVLYSQKLQIRFACLTEYKNFPFDKPECPIEMESYSMTLKDCVINWENKPSYSGDLVEGSSAELTLLDTEYETTKIPVADKEYGRLIFTFMYKRNCGYYLTTLFIPTAVFTLIAYITFFIDTKEIGVRLRLASLMMVCNFIVFLVAKSHLPHTRYSTAIDTWTAVCLTFNWIPLLATVIVHRLGVLDELPLDEKKPSGIAAYAKYYAQSADRFLRYVYIGGFLLFVAIYSAVQAF